MTSRVISLPRLFAAVTTLILPWLVTPAPAVAQGYVFVGYVTVPGNPLVSFGNSWVDPTLNMYFLADRSNKAIDVIPLEANPPVWQIIPTGYNAFAGDAGGNDSLSGPNGLITVIDPPNTPPQLFVTDGPGTTLARTCGNFSSVKVFTAAGLPDPTRVICTDVHRANQMCWAPPNPTGAGTWPGINHVRPNGILFVMHDPDPINLSSFVISIATSGPKAYNFTSGGASVSGVIGQCVYDPTTDAIYISNTSANTVEVVDPASGNNGRFQIDKNVCAAPQGMVLGSRTAPLVPGSGGDGQILLSCNSPGSDGAINSVSINNTTGAIVNIYENAGGNGQLYHTETPAVGPNGDWFLAGGSFFAGEQIVGLSPFVSSGMTGIGIPPPAMVMLVPTGFPGNSTRTTHSVASWAGNVAGLGLLEGAILPVPANGGGSPGFSSPICGSNASVGCIAFYIQSPITE
jgi:hypothetical protein